MEIDNRWKNFILIPISGEVKRQIIQTELREKIKDEGKIEDILSAFPLRVECTLANYRVSLVGKKTERRTKKGRTNTRTIWNKLWSFSE